MVAPPVPESAARLLQQLAACLGFYFSSHSERIAGGHVTLDKSLEIVCWCVTFCIVHRQWLNLPAIITLLM
jgi:hypothetical protein